MPEIVTLAERRARKLAAMKAALTDLDARLADYGRAHGGRFVRHGSSAKGRLRTDSDIDILVDFPEPATGAASRAAEDACRSLALTPDVRPAKWMSEAFLARALAEGVVLP